MKVKYLIGDLIWWFIEDKIKKIVDPTASIKELEDSLAKTYSMYVLHRDFIKESGFSKGFNKWLKSRGNRLKKKGVTV